MHCRPRFYFNLLIFSSSFLLLVFVFVCDYPPHEIHRKGVQVASNDDGAMGRNCKYIWGSRLLNFWWWEQKIRPGGGKIWENDPKSSTALCLWGEGLVSHALNSLLDLDHFLKCTAHPARQIFWCLWGRGLLVADTVSNLIFGETNCSPTNRVCEHDIYQPNMNEK